MPLSSGSKFGPYEIMSPLGAGGMGEVYRARDTRLDRVVAIKILPPHLSSDPSLKQRFEREARLISSLNHPHICVLHDIGNHDGTAFLVMECVEGETLARRLEKGPLPLAQVLKYGMQIADALDRAHRSGVVHRDLKPGNIMLTSSGAKLLDFGLAKNAPLSSHAAAMTTAAGSAKPITEKGIVVGTFQYMSPEQVEGKEVDSRSDIFSFGSVLYEMVTSRPAFQGKSNISVASAILEKDPEPVSTLQPMTPPALDRTIRVCLAKDPEERWQTARDVLLQLKWIADAGSQTGLTTLSPRRKLRTRLAWAAAAILPVALTVVAIGYIRRAQPAQQAMRSFILPPPGAEFFSIGNMAGPVVVSPDGRKLAFVARLKQGKAMLWVRPLDSLTAQPLAGTEDASYPFWAPDSRFIGFFADSKLKKIDSSGGPPQALCDVTVGRGGAWGPDGTIIFSPGANDPLFRVSASGGIPVAATELDVDRGDVLHRWPSLLPDGKHVLFFSRSANAERTGVYLASLESGKAELLLRHDSNAIYAEPGYVMYVREQTLVAHPFNPKTRKFTGDAFPIAERVAVNGPLFRAVFAASAKGVLAYQGGETLRGWQLMWYDRSGKQLGALGENARYQYPRFSPDGKKLVVSIVDQRTLTADLWIFDLARGTKRRFTFWPDSEVQSVWSGDGEEVIFGANQKGASHIYKKSASGLNPEQTLLETTADERPHSICRDGTYVAYQHHDAADKTRWDIWILPLTGIDRKPFPLIQSQFFDFVPMFSPDCKWLAYQSNESGRFEIYLTPFPGASGKWQVSNGGGSSPRWRNDGKELFFMGPANEMMAVDVRADKGRLELGTPHALFSSNAMPGPLGPFDVHPDGKRFLLNLNPTEANSEPITLVVNWTADLPKR